MVWYGNHAIPGQLRADSNDGNPEPYTDGCCQQQCLLQVCAEEHQRYLLFSSLLRHTGSNSMGRTQQAALVELAAAEGRALEGGLASPALVLAVKV